MREEPSITFSIFQTRKVFSSDDYVEFCEFAAIRHQLKRSRTAPAPALEKSSPSAPTKVGKNTFSECRTAEKKSSRKQRAPWCVLPRSRAASTRRARKHPQKNVVARSVAAACYLLLLLLLHLLSLTAPLSFLCSPSSFTTGVA